MIDRLWSLIFLFLCVVTACSNDSSSTILPEVIELSDYETVVSFKNGPFAKPSMIKFGENDNLFVYDPGLEKVLEISVEGALLSEYGRKGEGPGEFQSVSDLYITENYIYLVDDKQFLIHRYNRMGDLVSTMDYGTLGIHRINNPVVIDDELVAVPTATAKHAVYSLINWNGQKVTDFGDVPEGSTDQLDYVQYRAEVSSRSVPSYFRTHAFTVVSESRPNEVFLVYEAYPIVKKYKTSGELIWETTTIQAPELDSIAVAYFEFMEMILQRGNAITPFKLYASGESHKGRIFLSTSTRWEQPLWIHEINQTGQLVRRYRVRSKEGLMSHFTIDFNRRKIYVITEDADIRAYKF